MPTLQELSSLFEGCVREVANEFERAPAAVLGEEDLRSLIFSRLRAREVLSAHLPTADTGILGTATHCDLSWFTADGALGIRPDITILNPRNLSILQSLEEGVEFPRKEAHFVGEALIAELKFHRKREAPPPGWIAKVTDDLEKMAELIDRHRTHGTALVGWMVVFVRYREWAPPIAEVVRKYNGAVSSLVCGSITVG